MHMYTRWGFTAPTSKPRRPLTIVLFPLFRSSQSDRRLALIQKVQTPRPAPTPQERDPTRRLPNADARELAHPRIPLLGMHDERRAEPCPRPRPRYLCGTAVPRGWTATGTLLLVSRLFLRQRRERCTFFGLAGATSRALLFRLGQSGGAGEEARAWARCRGARKCVSSWGGYGGGCEARNECRVGGCERPFL